MADYRLEFFDPRAGAEAAKTLPVLVTAFDFDANHFPKRRTTAVNVRFGEGSQPVPAAKTGTSGWACTGTLPAGVRAGQQVVLTATASGLESHPAAGPDSDPPDPTPFTQQVSVTVVAESAAPVIAIDAFPTDVVAAVLPYKLALAGTAADPSGIAGVLVAVNGGGPAPAALAGETWHLDLLLGAGRHTVTVTATDGLGNGATAAAPEIAVEQPVPPTPQEQAFAVPSYLRELLTTTTHYLRLGTAATGPAPDELTARLHQPLAALMDPVNFAAATQDVEAVRIAIEALRGQLGGPGPAGVEQRAMARAYEVLLRELGTSSAELRLARGGMPPERAKLAGRLGIGLAASRPDRLDALTLDPDTLTADQLEELFGYRSTDTAHALAPDAPAALGLWRIDALRALWRAQDAQERDSAAGPRPVIDPDILPADALLVRDPANPVMQRWTERSARIAQDVITARQRLASAGSSAAAFDAALADLGVHLDFEAAEKADAAGDDITGTVEAAHLDLAAYRYLQRVRKLADQGMISTTELNQTASIVVQAGKRALFAQWRQEESDAGIVVDPAVFTDDGTDDAGRAADPAMTWRSDPGQTAAFRRTLRARALQFADAGAGLAQAVITAEAEALPGLRDDLASLVAAAAQPPIPPDQAVTTLSRLLALDLQAAPGQRITRAGQAVASLQALLTAARAGQSPSAAGAVSIADGLEADFDEEYAWLSDYPRWRSAVEAFAYPESRLSPQLFRAEAPRPGRQLAPTNAYGTFLAAVQDRSPLDPVTARALARTYLGDVTQELNVQTIGVDITDQRSNADITQLGIDARGLSGSAATESQIPQHLREALWLVPMTLAGQLTEAGHFTAALDWYKTVFAFQLPGDQRFVYHGLRLEQQTVSSFTRLPDWLSVVRELNPHFTARQRRGAYTRYTIQCIAECFLAFADSEFAQPDADSAARALTRYQTAADLLALPETQPETGGQIPYPQNPHWRFLVRAAEIGRSRVHAGLNIANHADAGPAQDATALLPSQYRYAVLVERARSLVTIGQQIENSYLATLERADAEQYSLLQAGHDLRAAQAQITIADLQVQQADTGITLAELQGQRAEIQRSTYADWINDGLSGYEKAAFASLAVATGLQALAGGFGAVQFGHEAAKSAVTMGLEGNPEGAFAQMLSSFAAAALSTAQASELLGNFERRDQEWRLNYAVAAKDAEIAATQRAAAVVGRQIADQQRVLAGEQLAHAQTVAEFLAAKFTNAELFQWMSGVLGRVYAYFLQQASAIAQLAQAQLAFERQEVISGFIAADYWQPDGSSPQAPDRRGLTGTERLLEDITRLDQYAFTTDRRKLHLTQTLSVAQIAGPELQRFRQTGILTFATPAELFDRDFPGHYLRLIKRVSVSLAALVPPVRGVRATLSASALSRTVVARDTFQTVTLRRDPESIAFTAPFNATGLFALETDTGMLLPFEGMGVDTLWQLELPKPANPLDYSGIADVLLTVEYTALDSPEYRNQVLRTLDRSFLADRTFSVRNDFPDAWFDLTNPDTVPDPDRRMVATLPVAAGDLPPHVPDLSLAHITLLALRSDGVSDEVTVENLRLIHGQGVISSTGEVTTADGIASTRRPAGLPWLSLVGTAPAGTWELVLADTPAQQSALADGRIQDLALVLTLTGSTPDWP